MSKNRDGMTPTQDDAAVFVTINNWEARSLAALGKPS